MRISSATAKSWGLIATRGKYGAQRVDGFDSKREAARWHDLLALRGAGEISDLRRQPEFHCWINGQLVCRYIADFMWTNRDTGAVVIEDCKGMRLPLYRLKVKLVRALFGVEIVES